MKTMRQIVQQFCTVTGLPIPPAVVGSTDSQLAQILGLLNEGLDELVQKYKWPQLQREATFFSTAVESQGTLEALAPGFAAMVPETFWSLTNKLPGRGSITPQETQALKNGGTATALVSFRQVRDELHFIPATTAGLQYRFEFDSRFAVKAADGTFKQYFTADTDVPVLPDILHTFDLRWRWKAEKELAYAEHFRSFQLACKQSFVSARGAMPVSLQSGEGNAAPGIVVPLGSWGQ